MSSFLESTKTVMEIVVPIVSGLCAVWLFFAYGQAVSEHEKKLLPIEEGLKASTLRLAPFEEKIKKLESEKLEREKFVDTLHPLQASLALIVKPYGQSKRNGPLKVSWVDMNYKIKNVGTHPVMIEAIIIRSFRHAAVSIDAKNRSQRAPTFGNLKCDCTKRGTAMACIGDAVPIGWEILAPSEIHRRKLSQITFEADGLSPLMFYDSGGIGEVSAAEITSGYTAAIAKHTHNDILGFWICVVSSTYGDKNNDEKKKFTSSIYALAREGTRQEGAKFDK